MTIKNRELSQFGSFIHVENSNQEIGITTGLFPYVGIGTTNPQYKLDVLGDTNVSGAVSATAYYLNGSPLVSAVFEQWASSGNDIYSTLSGNVGIGTSIPTSKLSVVGDVIISGLTTSSRFISTVSTGTAPFSVSSQTLVTNLNADYLRGKTSPSGDIVGTTDSQTLTNKSLTLPTFGGTGVAFTGSTSGVTTVRASSTASGVIVLPAVSGIATVITTGDTGTVTSNMIADLNITNADVSTTAGITYSKLNLSNSIVNADIASGAAIAVSKLASSTISGVSLGSDLNNLTAGSFITYDSGTTYNGSSAKTIGVAATTANTANTVVARDSSGDFYAGTINCSYLTATFDVTANSDENLKTNIKTIENAVDTINSLRGVTFDWKETGSSSVGIIAQELEKVLPQLISQNGQNKAVNYNGIIGVLIQAVKELSTEVEELKTTLKDLKD